MHNVGLLGKLVAANERADRLSQCVHASATRRRQEPGVLQSGAIHGAKRHKVDLAVGRVAIGAQARLVERRGLQAARGRGARLGQEVLCKRSRTPSCAAPRRQSRQACRPTRSPRAYLRDVAKALEAPPGHVRRCIRRDEGLPPPPPPPPPDRTAVHTTLVPSLVDRWEGAGGPSPPRRRPRTWTVKRWSWRFLPTGRSTTTGMLSGSSHSRGPTPARPPTVYLMRALPFGSATCDAVGRTVCTSPRLCLPDSCKSHGVLTAPAQRMTSRRQWTTPVGAFRSAASWLEPRR